MMLKTLFMGYQNRFENAEIIENRMSPDIVRFNEKYDTNIDTGS